MAKTHSNEELVTIGSYVGNGIGYFFGVGHPVIAVASGIERLVEDRNPNLQSGKAGTYIRLSELAATGYTALSALTSAKGVVESLTNGQIGHAFGCLVTAALAGGLTYAVGKKVTDSYGGLGRTLPKAKDDTLHVVDDAKRLYEKAVDAIEDHKESKERKKLK